MPEGAKKAVPYLCGGAFLSFASAKVRTSGDMAKLFNAFFSDFFTYTPALLIYNIRGRARNAHFQAKKRQKARVGKGRKTRGFHGGESTAARAPRSPRPARGNARPVI